VNSCPESTFPGSHVQNFMIIGLAEYATNRLKLFSVDKKRDSTTLLGIITKKYEERINNLH
jgi:hypothetical protein